MMTDMDIHVSHHYSDSICFLEKEDYVDEKFSVFQLYINPK